MNSERVVPLSQTITGMSCPARSLFAIPAHYSQLPLRTYRGHIRGYAPSFVNQKAIQAISLDGFILVAGAGFEPTTFRL